ncbi:MAG: peptidoglycan DD-metalloendopeptidase family protein [Alphaproteobacteria bacterium]|nr:peptidoglycan DD-metalloendopeptidase family protein [Alphaproteobacteria bacterium]
MKKTVLHILFSLPILFSAGFAHAVSEQEVQALEQKSDMKRMEYKKLQAESVALSLELAKMNKQLVEAAKRVQKDEDNISKTEEELKLLQKKMQRTEETFNKEYQNLADLLAAIQNLALHPKDSLLFQPLTPVEIIQSAVLMRETIPFINDNTSKLRKDLENYKNQKDELNKKLIELSKQTQDLKKQQENLKTLASQKTQIRKKLEGETTKTKQEAVRLAMEASDLRDLMEKAMQQAELERQKQEEIKRAAQERELQEQRKLEEEQLRRLREGRGSGFQGQEDISYQEDEISSEPIKSEPSYQIAKLTGATGQFVRPVRGELLTSYGQELSKGVTSKGVVFKTRPNAQVVAPYDGTVVFSGPFKGYGNLIIISHNSDVVSLIAGMQSVDTENGQMLLAGEPVGLMPDSDTAKLYMEIRKNKKPINPLPWLGH